MRGRLGSYTATLILTISTSRKASYRPALGLSKAIGVGLGVSTSFIVLAVWLTILTILERPLRKKLREDRLRNAKEN